MPGFPQRLKICLLLCGMCREGWDEALVAENEDEQEQGPNISYFL